jgi:hypothetical protein
LRGFEVGIRFSNKIEIFFVETLVFLRMLPTTAFAVFFLSPAALLCLFFLFLLVFVNNEAVPDL